MTATEELLQEIREQAKLIWRLDREHDLLRGALMALASCPGLLTSACPACLQLVHAALEQVPALANAPEAEHQPSLNTEGPPS